MNSDFRDLLSSLNGCRARYLVVGGQAVIHYAEPRYTLRRIAARADQANALAQGK